MNGQHMQIQEAMEGVQTEWYGDSEGRWGFPYYFQDFWLMGKDVYPYVGCYRYERAEDQQFVSVVV